MIGGRGLTIDVGTVKVQLAERTIDRAPDLTTSFSRSPFELNKPIGEGPTTLSDIAPQIRFQVSDYVGRYWEKNSNSVPAAKMRTAREKLEAACRKSQGVREALENFAKALEESRFVEATRLSTSWHNTRSFEARLKRFMT